MPAGRVVGKEPRGLDREQKKALVYEFADEVNRTVERAWRERAKRRRLMPSEGWRNVFHLVPDIDGLRLRMLRQRRDSYRVFWLEAKRKVRELHAAKVTRVELVIEE